MHYDMNDARDAEARALAIAEQVAVLLTELETVHPGSVSAHAGRISGLGVQIRRTNGQWTAESAR